MFRNYIATKRDLEAVEEALGFVLRPKMRFVFSDISKITKTLIVSYDSKFVYIWSLNPIKLIKIPHNLTILEEWQSGWWSGIISKQIEKYLPKAITKETKFDSPIISGSLLTPFISLQKAKKVSGNPYTTSESYLATIIHEFGHIYWNSYKLWWPSNKKENLDYLRLVINLHSPEKKRSLPKNFSFHSPIPTYLGEVFAFCTEYYASNHFWKNHKRTSDLFTKKRLNTLVILEKERDLDRENSVIEPTQSPHDYASILGKIILTKYPNNWPEILTKPSFVF